MLQSKYMENIDNIPEGTLETEKELVLTAKPEWVKDCIKETKEKYQPGEFRKDIIKKTKQLRDFLKIK